MKALMRFCQRLANVAEARRHDQRFKEEMEEHLALQTEDYVCAGMQIAEERRRAILKFGPVKASLERHYVEVRVAIP